MGPILVIVDAPSVGLVAEATVARSVGFTQGKERPRKIPVSNLPRLK